MAASRKAHAHETAPDPSLREQVQQIVQGKYAGHIRNGDRGAGDMTWTAQMIDDIVDAVEQRSD